LILSGDGMRVEMAPRLRVEKKTIFLGEIKSGRCSCGRSLVCAEERVPNFTVHRRKEILLLKWVRFWNGRGAANVRDVVRTNCGYTKLRTLKYHRHSCSRSSHYTMKEHPRITKLSLSSSRDKCYMAN